MRGSLHSIDQATSTRVRTAVDKAGRPPIPPPGKNLPSPGAAGWKFWQTAVGSPLLLVGRGLTILHLIGQKDALIFE